MKPINIIKMLNESSPFESKRVPEDEIREKGYLYFTTHGTGPGASPKGVKVREMNWDLPDGWCAIKTDRPLSDDELKQYGIQPETKNSELRKRFGLKEDTNGEYKTFEVVVGWNGYVGVEEEYRIGAYNRVQAVNEAIDNPGSEAELDFSVESIEDNGDGSYDVDISWHGADEVYTVNADDEDDAQNQALEEAKTGLEIISVDGTEFSYDEAFEGCRVKNKKKLTEETDDEEWKEVCEAFCKKIGAELLFVNSDNFGYQDKNGNLVHMYADELEAYLKNMNNKMNEADEVAETDEDGKIKQSSENIMDLAKSVREILKQCNANISYVDFTDYGGRNDKYKEIQLSCRFKADKTSKYSNDVSLYGKLDFNDNLDLVKSDLTTSSGPNVLNYDFIRALNALYGYFESGNKHYDL